MKYIIRESRLEDIFEKYMESNFDLFSISSKIRQATFDSTFFVGKPAKKANNNI